MNKGSLGDQKNGVEIASRRRLVVSVSVIGLIFLPALLIRFLKPLNFPAVFGDEALWNLGPKSACLTGDPLLLGSVNLFLSPLHYQTTLLLYRLLGPSLELSRGYSALFGSGVVLMTFLLGRRLFGERTGFIAAILCAYNSLLILSSRMAMLEQEVAFYMLCAAWLWLQAKPRLVLLSGVALAAALLVKIIAVALIPALILGRLLMPESSGPQKIWKRMTPGHWGALLVAGALSAFGYYMISRLNPDLFYQAWVTHSIKRVASAYHTLSFAKEFMRHFPELLLLALAGIAMGLKKKNEGTLMLIGWMAITFAMVSVQKYHPPRYYNPLIPALAMLSSVALVYLSKVWVRKTARSWALGVVVAAICVFQLSRLTSYCRNGLVVNTPMREAAAWIESHTTAQDVVMTYLEESILIKSLAIPINTLRYDEQGVKADPKLLPFLSSVQWIVFREAQLNLVPGRKASALSTYLSENNVHMVTQFGPLYIMRRDLPELITSP